LLPFLNVTTYSITAFESAEASDFKYSQHPPGALNPNNEDLLEDLKYSIIILLTLKLLKCWE
jgi:hypothetical protein